MHPPLPQQVAAALARMDEQLTALVSEARDRGSRAAEDARRLLSERGLPGSIAPEEAPDAAAATAQGSAIRDALWDRIRHVQIEVSGSDDGDGEEG